MLASVTDWNQWQTVLSTGAVTLSGLRLHIAAQGSQPEHHPFHPPPEIWGRPHPEDWVMVMEKQIPCNCSLLWAISHKDLRLTPTHSDQACPHSLKNNNKIQMVCQVPEPQSSHIPDSLNMKCTHNSNMKVPKADTPFQGRQKSRDLAYLLSPLSSLHFPSCHNVVPYIMTNFHT